ncbi:MAG: GMC family oxidoreductase [Burkholderiaceae bacterium]|nr:GMC family oxidoreductase [Burkholderiaceae bacterium]
MSFPDPITEGLRRGWSVLDAEAPTLPGEAQFDVAIVGTGAGGGTTAEILAHSGLRVLLVEEGPLRSSRDFRMRESEAYPQLYQESAARRTKDQSIGILQGRCVGGSTTVNWTSSFRTPAGTLAFWRDRFGLDGFDEQAMAPWFERMERRLSIAPWSTAPNENNDILRRGAERLGLHAAPIARNVHGCLNLGYCGVGCPSNAKQSMLVTTIPSALDAGATLYARARAARLVVENERAIALDVEWLDATGTRPSGRRTRVRAAHFVLAAGAIASPALLMRSGAPDPHGLLGARTFLHPVFVSAAVFDAIVGGWAGAPQSVYVDHFLHDAPIDGPIGYKLEAPPIHPVLFATTMTGFGAEHRRRMLDFAQTQATIALLRDGFHDRSPGGRVELRDDGSPVLDYPLDDFVLEGGRRALLTMAEIQFAAGARTVQPAHELAASYRSWREAREAIAALPMQPLLARVVSAHVMGGCRFGVDAARGVVDPDGVHWQWRNVSVHDGSLFPTSIGANPQLSVYGFAARLASGLAQRLTGRASAATTSLRTRPAQPASVAPG